MKSGFIGIIGRPNVGKSTLLNAVLGEKIAIATDKPQTTRNSIRGIYNDEDVQMIFIDTPGIHKPRNKLGEYMTGSALATFEEVDVILFLVDDELSSGPGDKYIVDLIKDVETPKYLVINKIDTFGPDKYKRIFDEYSQLGIFDGIFGISAKNNTNIDDVITAARQHMEEGSMFFPPYMATDNPVRSLVRGID